MKGTTTLSISYTVKAKLDDLKIYPEESYNSVISRLAYSAYDHEPLSEEEIKGIEEGLKDLKEGRVRPADEVWGDLENEKCTP